MKTRVVTCMVSFIFLLAVPSGLAQADKLIGVWQITEVQFPLLPDGRPGSMDITNPQPSIIIFTQKHFSMTMVSGKEPLEDLPKDPTKEQLLELFRTFSSVAGTYEVKDSTLAMHIIVSWVPHYMTKQTDLDRIIRFEGDALVLVQTPSKNPMIWKYTRLE